MTEHPEDPMELLYRFVEDGKGGWIKEPFPLEELGRASDDERIVEIDEEDEHGDR